MKKLLSILILLNLSLSVYAQIKDDQIVLGRIADKTMHATTDCPTITYEDFLQNSIFKIKYSNAVSEKFELCKHCWENLALKKAGTTYIPKYETIISVYDYTKNETKQYSWYERVNSTNNIDGIYSITVEHDSLTPSKVQDIIDAHITQNLSATSSLLGALGTSLATVRGDAFAPAQSSLETQHNAIMLAWASNYAVTAESLGIKVTITNTSSKEISVTDNGLGRQWYILPGQSISINGTDFYTGECRVSNGSTLVNYINFSILNFLFKSKPKYATNDFYYISCPPLSGSD